MNRHPPSSLGVALALAGLLGGACAAPTGARSRPQAEIRTPRDPVVGEVVEDSRDPRTLPMFDASAGGVPIGWPTLMDLVVSADAVLIGEVHGHAKGGAVTVAIFEDLLAHPTQGESVARAGVSLEFFERDHQPRLDDYLTDVIDEETFRHVTGRSEPSQMGPGNYPPAHRELVEAAKAAGRPVMAANAPRRYVTLSREESLDRLRTLNPAQRRLYEVPDRLTEGPYRDRFFEDMAEMLAEHMPEVEHVDPGEGDPAMTDAQQANLDNAAHAMIVDYYRAQNVWDATMAESIALALDRGLAPVVHVVGQFHVDHNGGLLQRLRALRPGARILTISLADDTPGEGGTLREEDQGRADVVIYVGRPD